MNHEKLERQLEEMKWQDREFGRHKVWLKKALIQIRVEKISWWKKIGIILQSMSLLKKFLYSGGVIVVALIIGIISSGKPSALAENLRIRMGSAYSDLSSPEKEQLIRDYWKKLQEYVVMSKQAQDLKFVGNEKITIAIPFDAEGKVIGSKKEMQLAMWQFSFKAGEFVTSAVKLGYDQSGIPQYFLYITPESKKPYQDMAETDWYKKVLQSYLVYAPTATDFKELSLKINVNIPSPEEIKKRMEPSLNEGNELEYVSKEVASQTDLDIAIPKDIFSSQTLLQFGQIKENELRFGLPLSLAKSTTTIQDVAQGKSLLFSLPNGRKELLVIGASGQPYYGIQIQPSVFDESIATLNRKFYQKRLDSKCHFFSDRFDLERIVAIYVPMSLSPQDLNALYQDHDFLNSRPGADLAEKFKPTDLSKNERYVIIDKCGLPEDLLVQLKKEVPDVVIRK